MFFYITHATIFLPLTVVQFLLIVSSSCGQIKDHQIDNCCFSVKYEALRSKIKDWLAGNQDNVSEWSNISTHWLLSQWARTIKKSTKSVGLVMLSRTSTESHRLLTVTGKSWRVGEGRNKLPFAAAAAVHLDFANTGLAIVHGQAFSIIIWQPHSSPICYLGRAEEP